MICNMEIIMVKKLKKLTQNIVGEIKYQGKGNIKAKLNMGNNTNIQKFLKTIIIRNLYN